MHFGSIPVEAHNGDYIGIDVESSLGSLGYRGIME